MSLSVGGTDLTTSSAGGAWSSETAWADGGGGISPDDIAIPSWQQLAGVITSTNKGSTVYRNGPDVSANANFTYYVCADQDGLHGKRIWRDQFCRAFVGRLSGSGQSTGSCQRRFGGWLH